MGGINLLAPKQCAHHPEERKRREKWNKLVTQGLTYLTYSASLNKCARTCIVLCIHTKTNLNASEGGECLLARSQSDDVSFH